MARTKEFDPDAALKAAVEVFWRFGYEHASLEMLMRAMGISKQSLYDTFGDKRTLHFRAMSHYRETTNASLRRHFESEPSVKRGFAKLFHSIVSEKRAQHERGCLLLNANLASRIEDVEIREFLQENQREVEAIFRAAFVRAKKRGELDRTKDPLALSKFFVATIQGMRALAMLNHDRKELEHIASVALAALE